MPPPKLGLVLEAMGDGPSISSGDAPLDTLARVVQGGILEGDGDERETRG